MVWVKPKSSLGSTTLAAGTAVKYDPTPVPGGFGWVVVVQLLETASQDQLEEGHAPPDTTSWRKSRLKNAVDFEVDERACGEVQQDLGNGLVLVKFHYVSAIVGDGDFEHSQ